MPRRQWDAKTKARIVIEGLQGKPVAELCPEPQISPAQAINGATSCWPMPLKPVRSMRRASVTHASPGRTPG
jgi:hypothetical protein